MVGKNRKGLKRSLRENGQWGANEGRDCSTEERPQKQGQPLYVERRGHLHDVNPMRERRARVTIQENCPRGTRELAVQFGRGAAETGTYTRDAVRAVTMN